MRKSYLWRKIAFKDPKLWKIYDICVHNDHISIKSQKHERKIYWQDIKIIQIFKDNQKVIVLRIICHDKKKNFDFSNQYAETFKKFQFRDKEFNELVRTLHKNTLSQKTLFALLLVTREITNLLNMEYS